MRPHLNFLLRATRENVCAIKSHKEVRKLRFQGSRKKGQAKAAAPVAVWTIAGEEGFIENE
eukprot:11975744-Alexandrium_andersonii.AAC.1